MISKQVRSEKQALIERSYKSGLEAIKDYSESDVESKHLAWARYSAYRTQLIVMQESFTGIDDELSDYCCELGLDLGNQALVILDQEASAA